MRSLYHNRNATEILFRFLPVFCQSSQSLPITNFNQLVQKTAIIPILDDSGFAPPSEHSLTETSFLYFIKRLLIARHTS